MITPFIQHPDGYFNVDGAVIPEDVFMDTFPNYPELPDGGTMRGATRDGNPYVIYDHENQGIDPVLTRDDINAFVLARDEMVAERNRRYPLLFTDLEQIGPEQDPNIAFQLDSRFPPCPNPKEIFDPAKRRHTARPDSEAGKSPIIAGQIVDSTPPPPTVASRILDTKAEAAMRINKIAPLWKQANTIRENPNDPIFNQIDAIREKSNLIEAHLATLTDAEAGAYDIENSPLWG